MKRVAKIKQKQKGLALVETTIVLALILLLALAVGEFGRALLLYNTLNKTQQDGARHLANTAVLGNTGNIVLDAGGNVLETKNLVVYGDVDGGATPLLDGLGIDDVDVGLGVLPGHIRVQVTYNFTPVFGNMFSTLGFGSDISLTFPLVSTVTMRAL